MERDLAAYLFTLLCPLFTSGASFSIAHEYSVRNLNCRRTTKFDISTLVAEGRVFGFSHAFHPNKPSSSAPQFSIFSCIYAYTL